MTEKELRKLNRHDLLELLVEQSREASRLGTSLKEREEELARALGSNGRLKEKLDEKDELIEKLKSRLDEKDAEMAVQAADTAVQLERLKEKLNEKDALVEKLKGRLDEKDVQLAEETAVREEQLKRLKEKLNAKDGLIDKLREQMDRRDEKNERLETEIERLRSDRWKEMKESGLWPELLERLKTLL